MATETTPNLALTIEDSLTSTAKANLRKIDELGSLYRTDQGGDANIQSANDIQLLPNYAPVGGSGEGGSIIAGSAGQPLTDFTVYGPLSLDDTATTYKLSLLYTSSTASANQTLTIDTNDASPTLSVEGNLTFSSYNLTFTQTAASILALPAGTETLVGRATDDTLTNKTINFDDQTLVTNLRNANVASDAEIAYSKLNLTTSIVNDDISPGAAIDGTKIVPQFSAAQEVHIGGPLKFVNAYETVIRPAASGQTAGYTLYLPPNDGNVNEVLRTDGSGNLTWTAVGLGTVTSVGLSMPSEFLVTQSPITTNGTLTVNLATQAANRVWAGPAASPDAVPTFRALVPDDIPSLLSSKVSDFVSTVHANLTASDSTNIDVTYDGAGDFTADLKDTTVTTGSFGAADTVPSYVVDQKGRLTASSSIPIVITASQVSDFTEAAQDAFSAGFNSTASVQWTYDDVNNYYEADVLSAGVDHDALTNFVADEHVPHSSVSIIPGTGLIGGGDLTANRTLNLGNTTVVAGSYGAANSVASFAVDAQGRLTFAETTQIAITASQVTDFVEAAQDAFTTGFNNTTSVSWAYDDVNNYYEATVLPAGVDHDSLANFVANEHIDHSAVSINPGTGLTGGGDITATRTLNLADTGATPGSYGNAQTIPTYTVDQQGRITANSSVTVDDNTKVPLTQKGAANGVATLDGGGKIPANQLPSTVMEYKGTWNASTNTPTLADGVGDAGDVYIVTTAGTVSLGSGAITFAEGDWALYNGATWEKSTNSNAVVSVAGKTGTVTLDTDDVTEATNLYYTEARVTANVDARTIGATWVNADGLTKVVNHGFLTNDVIVQLYDIASGESIAVDTITRNTTSQVTLTSSQAPDIAGSGWRILITKVL